MRPGPVLPALLLIVGLALAHPRPATAEPWMWDQDQDGIDDRLTQVFLTGITAAFENGDPGGRLRFEVSTLDTLLQYGGYVLYDHPPTGLDSLALTLAGAQVITRFEVVPYIRIRALYPTLVAVAAMPGVERIEAVTLMYGVNWRTTRATGVRSGPSGSGPSLAGMGGPTGSGVVVAILDTGINDGPAGLYPGHEDLAGKVAGGASYEGPGPIGYTPWNGSVNPSQSSTSLSSYHGTHVAGTVAGGDRGRTFGGVAPGASLLDVKVLDDAGTGHGLAEGLEWCVRNRTRDWGGGIAGIDVVNLSLSGLDASDGRDCVCRLVDAAAAGGIVVVASAGNDGRCGYLPAPAAADGAITVGAVDLGDPDGAGRPNLAPFSNEGPRHDDGDGSHVDEMKPDITAPGVALVSAWGWPLGGGSGWRAASGTSMSAAVVSGVAALLRESAGAIPPGALRDLVRRTARHRTGPTRPCSAGQDPYGVEPAWHAGFGFGEIDALAAWLELTRPTRTQFVALEARWDDPAGLVRLEWTTQREADLSGFVVERAPDVGGGPGDFVTLAGPPVPAMGFADLALGNRTSYSWDDAPAAGQRLWYRVRTVGGGLTDVSTPVSARSEAPVGTAIVNLRHNRPELDWTMTLGSGYTIAAPDWSTPLSFEEDLVAVGPTPGLPAEARYEAELRRPLHAGDGAAPYLAPSATHPWWFRADEAGSPDHSGQVTGFRIEVGPNSHATGDPLPAPTMEGTARFVWIPSAATSGLPERPGAGPELRALGNPAHGQARLALRLDAPVDVRVTVLDVLGRPVRRLLAASLPAGDHPLAWDGRDDTGSAVAAGRYYVRLEAGPLRRVTALTLVR